MSVTTTMLLLQAAERGSAQAGEQAMTTGGWILMGLAWAFVIGLAINCFWRVLGGGPRG